MDENFLRNEKEIDIEYLSNSKNINLFSGNRFKYTNKLMDYTIIEIFPSDNIKDFFDIDEGIENTFYKGQDICIFQHPQGKEISYSQGEIYDIKGFRVIHSASTKEGSSGSPIILSDKMTVIGIHSSSITNKNLNTGIFMKNIIEELYEKNLLKNIKDFKINYSTNQKGILVLNESIRDDNENEKIFMTGCPVKDCSNKGKLYKWVHECGASETIDRNGIVKCKNNHMVGEFYTFRYSCGSHAYKYGIYSSYLRALSICRNFKAEFAFSLTQKLMDAYKNEKIPG